MNMQVSSVSKFPDRVYVGYASRSELDLLRIIGKVRETPEFSEEDVEYSRVLGMLFVRPCILPLSGCQELKSPLYSWDGDLFKEMTFIRFEYCLTTSCWRMRLSLKTPDYQNNLISIVYNNDIISFYGDNCLKTAHAMGLDKLKEYYERKSLWSNS